MVHPQISCRSDLCWKHSNFNFSFFRPEIAHCLTVLGGFDTKQFFVTESVNPPIYRPRRWIRVVWVIGYFSNIDRRLRWADFHKGVDDVIIQSTFVWVSDMDYRSEGSKSPFSHSTLLVMFWSSDCRQAPRNEYSYDLTPSLSVLCVGLHRS